MVRVSTWWAPGVPTMVYMVRRTILPEQLFVSLTSIVNAQGKIRSRNAKLLILQPEPTFAMENLTPSKLSRRYLTSGLVEAVGRVSCAAGAVLELRSDVPDAGSLAGLSTSQQKGPMVPA